MSFVCLCVLFCFVGGGGSFMYRVLHYITRISKKKERVKPVWKITEGPGE